MFHIEIPKRSSCCVKGGESLNPGSDYYSVLIKGDEEGVYQRQDYCVNCWSQAEQVPSGRSVWKSRVPIKKEGSELPKQRDARALYLLKELLTNQITPTANAEAFVLALYLARRRLIVLRREVEREGQPPLSIYEVLETEEMVCVPKLSLSQLHVEQIQAELAKKFKPS
jgi:hypothetical protein